MKKLVVLALLLLVTVGAFALDKAVGGGILYNNAQTLLHESGSKFNYTYESDYTLTRNGFGAFGFFGIGRMWELNLGILYKNPQTAKYKYKTSNGYTESGTESVSDWLDSTAALQLGIYWKYPIPVSDMLVFFPTIGADMELTLDGDPQEDGLEWWNDFWLRGGVGLDVFLTERLFLRGHFIYGAAIPFGGDVKPMELKLGHGLLIKLGLGFML